MKILCIGHSYVVSSNRSIERQIAALGHSVTVLGPRKWAGDLRFIDFEAEPTGSTLE
jgi:hypothetical protein